MLTSKKEMPEIAPLASGDFYWGLIPREEMRRFIRQAEKEGFDAARKTFPFSGRFDYADDFSRADFHFFLPLVSNAQILDLGSGFGNITIPLAEHYGHITAADGSRELLEVSRIRARDRGCRNISFAHIDPIGSKPLPFADKSFDAVILNGVLEWTGLSDSTRNPREIHAFVLSEVARILREGGVLYVGIENRWFPGWFQRDPHSKLPWTVILPRFLADWYCRRRGMKDGYRTYIYGWRGYQTLFRKHFLLEATLIPYTSYRDPQVIYPKNREASSYLFKERFGANVYTQKWFRFLSILVWMNQEHRFVSSFMFILRKGRRSSGTALTRLLRDTHPMTFRSTDTLIKLNSKEGLLIAAIRQGERRPYGTYTCPRSPSRQAEFTPSQ